MPNINIVISEMSGGITDAYIRLPGLSEHVTQVPAGEPFEIYVSAANLIPDQSSTSWGVAFTATDGESIFQYKRRQVFGADAEHINDQKLDDQPAADGSANPNDNIHGYPIMPNHDITLIITLWGNETEDRPLPPITEWMEG